MAFFRHLLGVFKGYEDAAHVLEQLQVIVLEGVCHGCVLRHEAMPPLYRVVIHRAVAGADLTFLPVFEAGNAGHAGIGNLIGITEETRNEY
ncbi:hypothetical protein PPTS312_19150 [Pseudomonas putida]|uniref:Uncharacterized protein n=1 Tax=Pseudomonas putida TaxID=303 RepID=A0A7U6M157_PSEPU|nr:hypothetical protein PPTS312_19150 [Pseudomonas putida]